MHSQADKEPAPGAQADSDPGVDGGSELRGSAQRDAALAQSAAGLLSPEAAAVHAAASSGLDQGLGAMTSRLPSLVFRTPERQGGTYHLAFTHDSRDGRPESPAFIHLVVLYPHTGWQGVYDTARAEGGDELAVEPLKQEYADGFHTEHLRINLPDDVLAAHAATGLRIQVSGGRESNSFALELPAAHIEALLGLRFPDGLTTGDGGERESREAAGFPHAADEAAAPAELEGFAVEPSVADDTIIGTLPHAYAQEPDTTAANLADEAAAKSAHRGQTAPASVLDRQANRRTHMGPWPILAALGLIVVFLVWRFGFLKEPQQAPVQTQTPPAQALAEDSPTPALSSPASPPSPEGATSLASPVSPLIPPAAAPLVSSRQAAVGRFVEEWFRTANRNPRNAMRFYAPKVDYYQRGFVSKAYVETDKAQLRRRWPVRDNRIEGAITVTQSGDESRATFLFSYWLENGKQIRNGRARVLLSMQQRDGRYYIVRENAIALDAAGNAQNVEFYWRHDSSK